MNKMQKACYLGKPLIYFNKSAQLWYMCYASDVHGDKAWKAALEIVEKLNECKEK